MDYSFFKVIHFASIGAMVLSLSKKSYWLFGLLWILVLASSFGLVSTLGLHENFPKWADAKFGLWIIMGALALTSKFKPQLGKSFSGITGLLLVGAIYLAVYKPF
ncbi:hypothetical protein [Peredibacter starrii]|uniref:Invasion protein n=1 Tax=Peredibacter starrii TaxID=28202 RepID=A0AAX4HTD4_9BACT|nr:hypothetical protein [Peredibacter starrii]WPU66619.1 hypothetical protein SOO65_07660 [Peredibacter starrii]